MPELNSILGQVGGVGVVEESLASILEAVGVLWEQAIIRIVGSVEVVVGSS